MSSSVAWSPAFRQVTLDPEAQRARAEQELRRRARLQSEGLIDFIPRITRRFTRPRHLAPLLALFERFRRGERVRVVVSTPPRHGKTEALTHGMAFLLAHRPALQIIYLSYASRFAENKSRKTREIAITAGVPISPLAWARQNWRTGVDDGGVWATAIAGQVTGEGAHLMVVDDPVKDRATAESPVQREHHYEWFTDTAYTRLEPGGSVIVNMTRWHEDDLAGRLIRDGWEYINLPALDDEGRALWPERWPAEHLHEIRKTIGEYGWASLYMGQPRPRGAAIFRDVHFYEELPKTYRVFVGVDLAYTAKKQSDWCVAVVVAEADGVLYVLDVKRAQATPPEFAKQLRAIKAAYPGARWRWKTSTTEQGLADLMRSEMGFPLLADVFRGDKFVYAQPAAAGWNAGRIRVPRGRKVERDGVEEWIAPPWVAPFVEEVCSFTGLEGCVDDQVDGVSAAWNEAAAGTGLLVPRTHVSKFTPYGGNPFAPSGEVKWK